MNEDAIALIKAHIPSLTDSDEAVIASRVGDLVTLIDADIADLAVRTCACGERVDGFYEYVDHLIGLFGGESHYGG